MCYGGREVDPQPSRNGLMGKGEVSEILISLYSLMILTFRKQILQILHGLKLHSQTNMTLWATEFLFENTFGFFFYLIEGKIKTGTSRLPIRPCRLGCGSTPRPPYHMVMLVTLTLNSQLGRAPVPAQLLSLAHTGHHFILQKFAVRRNRAFS